MIGKTVSDAATVCYHPSLVFVAFLALGFSWLSAVYSPDLAIVTRVFLVSGTLVALVLPAAGLCGALITRIVEYWLGRLADAGDSDKKRTEFATLALEFIREARMVALTGWRGSVYALLALALSSVALFTPRLGLTIQSVEVLRVDYLILSVALGFLLVGAFLFFPLARWIFRLEVLRQAESAVLWAQAEVKET